MHSSIVITFFHSSFTSKLKVGAKKCGLGAQKLSSKSFNEIEKQAQAVDKLKETGKAKEKEEPL